MDILFFDDMPLDSHNPEPRTKVRGLVRRGHRVAVVDKIGINDPSPANLVLIARRLGSLARPSGVPELADRWNASVGVMRPSLLPPRNAPGLRTLNRWWLRRSVLRTMARMRLREPVLWMRFPSPELVDIIGDIPHLGIVYECVDDFPAFIHWSETTRERLRAAERHLVEQADLLVVTAPALAARLGDRARAVVFIPNGVDLELFDHRRPARSLPPQIEERLREPVVGFVGALDLRVDYVLLAETARAIAPATLLMVGPKIPGVDLGELPRIPNVVFVGEIPHDRVPDFVRRFDVCLLPYDTRNALVDSVSPVKLFEYLALGRPSVSVEIPAVEGLRDVVRVAGTREDFVREVLGALGDDDPGLREARRARAAGESWETRLDELEEAVQRVLRPNRGLGPRGERTSGSAGCDPPLVSVVMPVFNVESFVAQAIESVLSQTHANLELVIVDDGSEDGSLEICRGYQDERIRIISQSNRGLAGARNTGLRNVTGEYVALLDSDDLWGPTKLEEHLRHLERNPGVGVSYSYSVFIDHDGGPLGYVRQPKVHSVDARDIFLRDPLHPSAPVIRRQVLEDVEFVDSRRGAPESSYFDEDLRRCEDLEFWLRIALTTRWAFEGIPRPLSYLRINPGGLSSNLAEMMESWEQCVEKVRGYAPAFVSEWEALARAFQQRFLARRAVRNGDGRQALALAVAAVRQSPEILSLEPATSAVTIGAALAQVLLPAFLYDRVEELGFRVAGGFQSRPR